MINFIRGYYTVTVEGLGTESFLNYLIRNKITVYNVNRIDKTKIQFNIDRSNFKKLKKIHRSNKFDIKVKKQTGIPFIARRIYTYRGMVICAIISFGTCISNANSLLSEYPARCLILIKLNKSSCSALVLTLILNTKFIKIV